MGIAPELPVGEVQKDLPVAQAVVVGTFAEMDADAHFGVEQAPGFAGRLTGMPRARRVCPKIAERLGREIGARRDGGDELVLVEGHIRFATRVVGHSGPQPVREDTEKMFQRLGTRPHDVVAPGAAGAGIVGRGQRDALVGGAGEQCRLAAARVTDDRDLVGAHDGLAAQEINTAVVAPSPGGDRAKFELGKERIQPACPGVVIVIRRQFRAVKEREDEAAPDTFVRERIVRKTPAGVTAEHDRERPRAVRDEEAQAEANAAARPGG